MAVTVIDSKGELEAFQAEQNQADALQLGKIPEKAADSKPEEKTQAKAAAEAKPTTEETDPDDVEGEDGLTPREKRDLSAKMLRALNKRVAQRKDAEEFAAAQYSERRLAESRAANLEQELQALKVRAQPEQIVVASEAGKPQREKFEAGAKGDEAYWEAVIDWRADLKFKTKAEEDAKAAAERRQAEIIEAAKERISKALELVPDFKEVTEAADVRVPPVVAGYMQKSEMFAELGYHLAKNPKLLESLAKLPPDEQLVTIGKIESNLKPFAASDAEATDGATPSKAAAGNGREQPAKGVAPSNDETGSPPSNRARGTAPVIRPLNGSGATAVEIDPRDMNIRETIHDWSRKNQVNFGVRKRH